MIQKRFTSKLVGAAAIASTLALFSCTSKTLMPDNGAHVLMNQVAFYPEGDKILVLDSAYTGEVEFRDMNNELAYVSEVAEVKQSPFSGAPRYIVDFSGLDIEGKYQVVAGDMRQTLEVKSGALRDVAKAALKAFYYQRSGVEIEAKYAGKWARPLGHPDTNVMVHPTAATKERPAGTIISSPFGWYDAGDYNKYIVNSAYSIGIMLQMYETIPEYFEKFDVDIPETGNGVPDLLDEIYFNLKWMATMQDTDGGLYHKLTTPNFEAFIMPSECKQQRYVVQKSVTASYDYAACMAMVARIYAKYDLYAEFAKEMLESAKKAYKWAKANPTALYFQGKNNEKYDPDVVTGEYGDFNASDEQLWAATELYISTGDESYWKDTKTLWPKSYGLSSWGNVASIAQWELISKDNFVSTDEAFEHRKYFNDYIETLEAKFAQSDFACAYGAVAKDFHWGCLSEGCCNAGAEILRAYKKTGLPKYRTMAVSNADYILGRNPMRNCYVTGFGYKSTKNPHQRLSHADGIEDPLPGFLAGGPNPGKQDGLTYPCDYPDMCYLDDMNSYASNEIAINWNASLVAFLACLDDVMSNLEQY